MNFETLIQNKEFITIVGAIIGYWIRDQKNMAVLNEQVKEMKKDIDGIAEFIGTPRALSRKRITDVEKETSNG